MKIYKHIKRVNSLWIFLLSIAKVFGQSKTVPHAPKKVRSLPTNFKDEYKGDDFDYVEHISYWEKIKAWFYDWFMRWFNMGSENASETLMILKYTFFTLVIIAVIYYIVKLIVNKEGRWLFSKNKEAKNAIDYEEVQNIKEADFKKLISEAESASKYRTAIKLYYLYLLKKMDESEVITYDSQKTSHDYLLQLEGTKSYSNFSKAAYYYTYIWYGEFKIDAEEYQTASASFVTLLKQYNNE